jgi:hypothetical protein
MRKKRQFPAEKIPPAKGSEWSDDAWVDEMRSTLKEGLKAEAQRLVNDRQGQNKRRYTGSTSIIVKLIIVAILVIAAIIYLRQRS